MVDVAFSGQVVMPAETVARTKVLDRLRLGDSVFRHLTRAAAIVVLLLLSGVIISLIDGSIPAFKTFGFGFLVSSSWNPVTDNYGALPAIYGTILTSLHRDADCRSGWPDDRILSDRALPAMAAAADRYRDRTARRHPQHHLRHLGIVHVRTISAGDVAALPDQHARQRAGDRLAVCRAALRHRHADRRIDPRHHGAAVRDLDLA